MGPSPPIISVFGAPGSGRRSLVSCLLYDGTRSSAAKPELGDGDAPWRIHTKYYTADVAFRVKDCCPSPSFDGEAIVLVFNATCQHSFSAIQAWASSHSESTEEAGVRLVVATHADRYAPSSPALQQESSRLSSSITSSITAVDTHPRNGASSRSVRPQWLVDAMDWCAGECYEYVECSTTDALVDQQLRLEGDVQGIARIKEALQAHMWPGLTMREQAGASSSGAQGADGDRSNKHEEDRQGAAPALPASQPCEGPPGSNNAEHQGQQREGDPDNALAGDTLESPQQPQHEGQQSTVVAGVPELHGKKQHQHQHQHQQPRKGAPKVEDLDQLEKLMEQMAAAKQHCHRLSDDQRREQAAALAMRFASMLGSDSEGEEGSSGSDNEQNI